MGHVGGSYGNTYQGQQPQQQQQQQPQQGNAFGMPQNSAGFPGANPNPVGVAALFNGQVPGGMVGARPGAAGAPSMSNPGQGRVGMGAVSAGTGPGAVINGPRGPMPMGAPGAPTTSMGLTVGGAPVVGSSGAAPGRPTAPGMTGYNPSGEIMAMLGKGPAGSMAAKMPGGALGSSEEHDLPNFGADDFPALGGGMGSVPVYRSGSSDTLGAAMGGMQGGMSGIAAAKLPQDFQMASEDFPALPGLGMREGENGMDQMDMNIPDRKSVV